MKGMDLSPEKGSFCKLRKSFILFSQLAELKQECLARGLETKGIKQDLINRLQAYLEEHAEEEANEEDVLGDETEEEEPKPLELPVKEEEPPEKTVDVFFDFKNLFSRAAEKKVVKITSEIPQTERMQKRAERFNVPVSLESKKAARAARFGISPVPSKGLSSDTKPMVNLDKLKERAQRFGLNVSSISRKSEDDEKLKKRKERFGIVTSSAGTGTTEDTENSSTLATSCEELTHWKRLMLGGIGGRRRRGRQRMRWLDGITDSMDAKKRKRAERFGIA
ncbi:SAP domain-containing ribonucleoprotein isoform X2 [Bubalus kerabau]|uniref:SAP domain-containing ribonucleoprotein isoform X2 n=1 Tax=Bubalus carabanensis TaxID=3119969 RepID=UPI00244EEA7C|nr:SAP domain-containing ribonucleoprotein isoform X2 [Bubalus carabanensis]